MKIVEDVRKTVSNPKPLYFAAGVGDAAVEALKDAPARLTVASAKAGEKAIEVVGKVAGAAETVQSRIALAQIDPKALRERIAEPDLRAVRERTQNLVLAQVGWALEAAGKAVETYDEYSERGKGIVERVLSGRSGTDVQVVTVERIVDEKPVAETIVVDEVEEIVVVEEVKPPVAEKAPTAPTAKSNGQPTAKPAAKPNQQTAQAPQTAQPTEPPAAKTTTPRRTPSSRRKAAGDK